MPTGIFCFPKCNRPTFKVPAEDDVHDAYINGLHDRKDHMFPFTWNVTLFKGLAMGFGTFNLCVTSSNPSHIESCYHLDGYLVDYVKMSLVVPDQF